MRKHNTGFTLMEVMITVVIVGILAAIAYPSYTNYMATTRRSDATIALTALAAQQEKFFTQCGVYADTIGAARACPAPGPAGGVIDGGTVSLLPGGNTRDGFYNIVITPGTAPGNTMANSFTLTATPLGGQLARDGGVTGKCTTIVLTSTGEKQATGSDSLLGPNGGKCWKK